MEGQSKVMHYPPSTDLQMARYQSEVAVSHGIQILVCKASKEQDLLPRLGVVTNGPKLCLFDKERIEKSSEKL